MICDHTIYLLILSVHLVYLCKKLKLDMRMLCEKVLDHGKEVFICFVDYEKVLDRMNWVKMMDTLKQLGADWRDRRLIWKSYIKQQVLVRFVDQYTDTCRIGKGVRQGCRLSY